MLFQTQTNLRGCFVRVKIGRNRTTELQRERAKADAADELSADCLSLCDAQAVSTGRHASPPRPQPPVSSYPSQFWQPGLHHPSMSQHEDVKPFAHHPFPHGLPHPSSPSHGLPHPASPRHVLPHPVQPHHPTDTKPLMPLAQPPASPPWLTRSIATSRLRLLEHSAFVENQTDQDSYQKHLFVHIGSAISHSDPPLEVSAWVPTK